MALDRELKEELERWASDEGVIKMYRDAIGLLNRSGIFSLLRRVAVPPIIDNGRSVEVMAGVAHWSNGYNKAIDHLLYMERYFSPAQQTEDLGPPDFGGLDALIKSGLLKEDE